MWQFIYVSVSCLISSVFTIIMDHKDNDKGRDLTPANDNGKFQAIFS